MKKKYITLLVFFAFQCIIIAQTSGKRVTLNVQEVSLIQVLEEIEKQTELKFFYVEEWVSGETVTANYQDSSLEEVLEELFDETLVNYFIFDENRVVLTQNNIIYDELPEGFFYDPQDKIVQQEIEADALNPVFHSDEPVENRELETISIGKESRYNQGQRFSLRGRVTDTKTGEPISNLSIMVRDKSIGAVTDANGYYELRLPAGPNILQTQALGTEDYEKRVVIFNEGTLNISLRESYEQLGEIFLESNADKNVEEAVTGREQINVQEIKNIPLVLGERDILKVATTLPGITTAGEGSAGYNVRGGRADQNLILLDDAVIYNPSHFFGIFSALNPFTSGDANIYKGSIPAEYGGRLSAVFDIRTKDANTEEFGGEASIGPVTSNLALEIPIVKEKSGLIIGGRSTYSDWILNSLDEESLQGSTASFYDVVGKYNHIIDNKSEIEATGYFSRDVFSITTDSLYSYSNRLGSLRYNRTLNDKNRGSLILTNSDYKFNIDYESEFSNNFSTGYNISETELKLNMRYLHSRAHQISYGVAGKLYRVKPGSIEPIGSDSNIESLMIPQEKGLETAIYLADSYRVTDELLLNAGIRYSMYAALGPGTQGVYEEGMPKDESTLVEQATYDNNEVIETYGGPELRFSARYFILPDLSAKVSYNNSYQYIHTLTNNTTMSPTDTYKLSDLNIKPQTADQFSAGLYKNFDQNTYEVSVEGYYKQSENMLDFKVGAQLFLNENIETEVLQGEGQSYGAELLLKKTKGRLNGWLGYSYTRSMLRLDGEFNEQRVNNGEYFPASFDKPHDVSLVTNYKITKRYSFSANFVYQTGRPVTYPVGQYHFRGQDYVFYSDRNKFRIPDYYRLDLSFNMEGNHKNNKIAHSFWNLSVYNVLGRNNPYSVFFVTDEGEVKAMQSSIFSIPIPTITYNIKF